MHHAHLTQLRCMSCAEPDPEQAGSWRTATAAPRPRQTPAEYPAEPSPRATPQQLAQWERVRAHARDPNFVVDDQILRRYAGVASPRRLATDDLVVIMMASAMRADLARVMRETWLRAHPHVLIVGDAENASVPVRLRAPPTSSPAWLGLQKGTAQRLAAVSPRIVYQAF